MKELLNIGNGLVVISEEAGKVTLAISGEESLGGGQAAGILSAEGSGKVQLSGKQAFDLGMKLLESHVPGALVPLLETARVLADALIDKA